MRLQRFCFFLIVWLLMFSGEIISQEKKGNIPPNSHIKVLHSQKVATGKGFGCDFGVPVPVGAGTLIRLPVNYSTLQNFDFEKQLRLDHLPGERPRTDSCYYRRYLEAPLQPNYYSMNLGLICKTEIKLDNLTPIPVRFRLGSLEYVNWMEGKPNAVKPR